MADAQHAQVPLIPDFMAGRPIDHRGYPVPWFVTEKHPDGTWDFVGFTAARLAEALRREVCWVSGAPLGRYRAFVIGPMCLVNRISADAPVRREVAEWSVRICPFLRYPNRGRDPRTRDMSDQRGLALERNPGVSLVYVTREVRVIRDGRRGALFQLGEPASLSWWREGRPATNDEIMHAVESGLPTLVDMARREGAGAVAELRRYIARAEAWLPRKLSIPEVAP